VPHYHTWRYEQRVRGFGVPGNMTNPYTRHGAWGFKSIGEYNTFMHRGQFYACGSEAGKYTVFTSGAGHGGPDYPGVASVRRGKGYYNTMEVPRAL
jgi:hypothetical protein